MNSRFSSLIIGITLISVSACTEKVVDTSTPTAETSAIIEEPKGLPLNPAKAQWEDFSFDVAIRPIENVEQLIMIMRKGAFMNQVTKNIDPGFALKGTGAFDYNENGNPELVVCYGNSSGTRVQIAEIDASGVFTDLTVSGEFTVLPEAVNIILKDSRVLFTDVENRVLSSLIPVNNDGKLEFNAE